MEAHHRASEEGKTDMSDDRYDVLGVNLRSKTVRIISRDLSAPNADALVKLAVMRRGIEDEFFVE
jgi:hypothetical protein